MVDGDKFDKEEVKAYLRARTKDILQESYEIAYGCVLGRDKWKLGVIQGEAVEISYHSNLEILEQQLTLKAVLKKNMIACNECGLGKVRQKLEGEQSRLVGILDRISVVSE